MSVFSDEQHLFCLFPEAGGKLHLHAQREVSWRKRALVCQHTVVALENSLFFPPHLLTIGASAPSALVFNQVTEAHERLQNPCTNSSAP